MKLKMKRVLSLVLSIVMVVTGLTITPATTANVKAAASDVFITDKIIPEGETSEDFSHMYYWKGQEIELSVAVYAQYQNQITWETSDSKVALVGKSDTSTAYTVQNASGYVVKQKFKIADDAQGEYTITAKNGTESLNFKFTVQDSYMTPIASTKFDHFGTTCRWTKDEIDLYVITKAGVTVNFTSDNDLVTIQKTDTCDSSKLYYYGKGSEVHKVTAVVGDKVNTENQVDYVTITATDNMGKTETLAMTIRQSADKVVDDSITVTCDDKSHSHDTITHINDAKTAIYLDAHPYGDDEAKTTATLSFYIEGSEVDNIYISTDAASKNFTIGKTTCQKIDENLLQCVVELTDLLPTQLNKPTYIKVVSASTHVITKQFDLTIYKGGKVDDFELKDGSSTIATSGLTKDEGATGKFSIKANDTKESVKWSVTGATGVLTVDPETGDYQTIAGGSGTARVTATLQATNSGTREYQKSFDVIVTKAVAPDKIEILDANKELATSTSLYVGDNPTTFYRSATKGGFTEGIYYSNYQNVLSTEGIVALGSVSSDGAFQVTPKAKGTTRFYIKTADGTVTSQFLDFKVIAPIETITVKKDGQVVNTIPTVEDRELILNGERDDKASDDETIKWSATGNGSVKFVDDDGQECDTYEGNTCRVVTKKKGLVTIKAEATGLENRSKATTTVDLTIDERIPADSVSFFADEEIQKDNTSDTPYEIKSGESKTFTIKGFSTSGSASNDEFSGVYEATLTGTTANWANEQGGFVVKAGTTPGTVELTFKNEQTDATYKFYVKIVIPTTELQILDGNDKAISAGLVLQENDEYRLGISKKPANSTDGISWYSSDSSIVSVTQQGDLKVLKYSTEPVTITAKADSGVESTCEVYVVKPITNITIDARDASGNPLAMDGNDVVYLNDEITASATVLPADATDIYNWTTSNAAVASITTKEDGSCVITAKGQGTTTISATPRLLNSESNVAKTFVITVAKKPNSLDVKANNSSSAESIVATGLDLSSDTKTLYAILDPEDSYDVVRWNAEPTGVIELTPKNNGKTHSCEIKKLQTGKVATLTVSTSSGLTKTIQVTTGISLAECQVSPIVDKAYDGSAYKPSIVINNPDGEELTITKDYTVTFPRDMTNAGKKEITITGKGLYCDTITVTCQILPQSISDATVNINGGKNYTYTGEAITLQPARGIEVNVPNGTTTKKLSANDYDVTCANNVNAGTATVTISGKGNYAGTLQKTFQIDAKEMSKTKIQLTPTTVEYTGKEVCPEVVIKDGTKELKADVDYTVAYSNNVNVSNTSDKPTVTVTGKGNYAGTATATFSISTAELKAENVTLSKTDYNYTGKDRKPKVTVYSNAGKKLVLNTDYTVTYPTDMASVGLKSITITGKGNFKGTVKAEYGVAEKITVKKATIKTVKNSKSKAVAITIKSVSGASGYEISYSTSKKFDKDTTKVVTSKKAKKTIKKLTKGKTYYFKVRAYKVNSLGRKIYGKPSAVKKVKIKK